MLTLPIGTIIRIGEDYFEITGREPYNYETTTEFAALLAGANSNYIQIPNMEPQKTIVRLMYILMGFDDGLTYRVQYQMGTERWGTDKDQGSGYLNAALSPRWAMNEDFAFWLMTNDIMAVRAENATQYPKTPKVYFQGFKYDITPIVELDSLTQLAEGLLEFFVIPRGVKEAGA